MIFFIKYCLNVFLNALWSDKNVPANEKDLSSSAVVLQRRPEVYEIGSPRRTSREWAQSNLLPVITFEALATEPNWDGTGRIALRYVTLLTYPWRTLPWRTPKLRSGGSEIQQPLIDTVGNSRRKRYTSMSHSSVRTDSKDSVLSITIRRVVITQWLCQCGKNAQGMYPFIFSRICNLSAVLSTRNVFFKCQFRVSVPT